MRKWIRAAVLAEALLFGTSCAGTARRLSFPTAMFDQHLIGSVQPIELSGQDQFYDGGARVDIVVRPDGSVSDATVRDVRNQPVQVPQVRERALMLHFRPFEYEGQPVEAVGTVQIPVNPPAVWAKPNAPFPPVSPASLEITLTRTACFGSCPDYRVTISGDGHTLFVARPADASPLAELFRQHSMDSGVIARGTHVGNVDPATVQKLVSAFRSAHFFGLKKDYSAGITDNPTYTLRLRAGDEVMVVSDYVGNLVGMPHVVTELEDAVDAAADTQRWTSGNARTVPALLAEGMKVDGPEAIALAADATRADGGEVVLMDLIHAGLPLDRPVTARDGKLRPLGDLLMIHAIRAGRRQLARKLIDKGWLRRVGKDDLDEAFAAGGGGCSPDLARQLVAAGASPRARTPVTGAADFPDGGSSAVMSALDQYGPCEALSEDSRLALVQALLHLGADVNAVDGSGRSALFFRQVPDEQALLLQAGANVNVRSRQGDTPVQDAASDSEALPLLEAGADPHGKNSDGKSLRQTAQESNMPATVRWLDQHGIP